MNANEIKELCINGARLYYNYLEEKDEGFTVIRVNNIEQVNTSDNLYNLQLSGKLFNTDLIAFRYIPLNKEYSTLEIKIREYDYDNNTLIIKPSYELPFSFKNISNDDIELISDLKFLLKNIENYFKENGNNIKLPTKATNEKIKITDFDFLEEYIPDENQKRALLNIFKNPLSYIWGAPGTGKTRIVLANSIIKYIKQGKRVAVFAATNVALEQVLSGILEITDKANIDRKNILRVGNPSKKFANNYPEVCEVAGIQKKIKQISAQIRIIENILGIDDISNDRKSLDKLISFSEELDSLTKSHIQLEKKYNIQLSLFNSYKESYEQAEKKLEIRKKAFKRSENRLESFSHRMIKLFFNTQTYREKRHKKLYDEIQSLRNELVGLKTELKKYQRNKDDLLYAFTNYNERSSIIKEQINLISFFRKELEAIYHTMSLDNVSTIINKLENEWSILNENNEINASLKKSYSGISEYQLKIKLEEYRIQKDKFSSYDSNELIKKVHVIGATLDGYIGRFPEANLHADHYFIDEAGYANIIKALSIFVYNKPVTLLGDHMQLLPVFLVDEQEITPDNSDLFVCGQSAIFTEHLFINSKDVCYSNYKNKNEFIPNLSVKSDLNCTHRFGINLAKVLDKHVYKNNFTSKNKTGTTNLYYINVKKCPPLIKWDNSNEVDAIENYLSEIHNDDYCILTPYRNQVSLLKERMPNLHNEEKILTVHKSQGREWNTVILSVCDTRNKFLTDSTLQKSRGKNLINTAVSRAKKQLIIVCDYNYWINQENQLITSLLSIAKQIKL